MRYPWSMIVQQVQQPGLFELVLAPVLNPTTGQPLDPALWTNLWLTDVALTATIPAAVSGGVQLPNDLWLFYGYAQVTLTFGFARPIPQVAVAQTKMLTNVVGQASALAFTLGGYAE